MRRTQPTSDASCTFFDANSARDAAATRADRSAASRQPGASDGFYGRDTQRNDALLYVHSGRSLVVGLNYKY